jgi:hypothetical protein
MSNLAKAGTLTALHVISGLVSLGSLYWAKTQKRVFRTQYPLQISNALFQAANIVNLFYPASWVFIVVVASAYCITLGIGFSNLDILEQFSFLGSNITPKVLKNIRISMILCFGINVLFWVLSQTTGIPVISQIMAISMIALALFFCSFDTILPFYICLKVKRLLTSKKNKLSGNPESEYSKLLALMGVRFCIGVIVGVCGALEMFLRTGYLFNIAFAGSGALCSYTIFVLKRLTSLVAYLRPATGKSGATPKRETHTMGTSPL